MPESPDERTVDREVGVLSFLLVPFGILVVVLWLLIMYTIAVHWFPHAFGIDWPNPWAWVPPGWRRVFGF